MLNLVENGFLDVKIGDVEKRVDVYRAHFRLVDAQRRTAGKPRDEFYDAAVEVLKKEGFEHPSHLVAFQFIGAINRTMAEYAAEDAARDTELRFLPRTDSPPAPAETTAPPA